VTVSLPPLLCRCLAGSPLSGEPIRGTWFNRTAKYRARLRGEDFEPRRYATEETVVPRNLIGRPDISAILGRRVAEAPSWPDSNGPPVVWRRLRSILLLSPWLGSYPRPRKSG
jgi:hypothetical protein